MDHGWAPPVAAARSLSYSASKTFAVALFVVCVLSVCGLASFERIAAPRCHRERWLERRPARPSA